MKRSLGYVGRIAHGDQSIGICGISDDEDLHVAGRAGVQRLTLRLEYLTVGFQEVGALHSLRPRPRAHQQRDTHPVEGLLGVVEDLGGREQREGAVLQLERGSFGGLHGVGDLEQPQLDLLVGPEHLSAGYSKQQGIADLPGRAGDGDCGCHLAVHLLDDGVCEVTRTHS